MSEHSPTILLTGSSHSGKSTVCARVVEFARAAGLTVGGIVTENRGESDGTIAQHVVDLTTGHRRLLATATAERARVVARYEGAERPFDAHEFAASWVFEDGALAFANAALEATVAAGCELLVVDQIGPLELRRGGGLSAVFDAVLRGRHALALVVVHPLVLTAVERRFPEPREVFEVTADTRDGLPPAIVERCLRR